MPTEDALDVSGLDLPPDALAKLLAVDPGEWRDQLPRLRESFALFGDKLPASWRSMEVLEELGAD